MNQVSIYSWFGFLIPMEERFKLIKEAGFDGVLLWWSDEYAEVDGDKSLHPDLARRNGLFIENIHTPIYRNNCLWEDGINGDEIKNNLLSCIDDCKRFEIPTAVVHITSGSNPPPCNKIGLDRINYLVEAAERNNVKLALENLRRPEYLGFVFSNIQSEKLGFCYDSGHEYCFTKGTDLLAEYGARLMALHLHDNDGTEDQHLIPCEGLIDWKVVLEKLCKAKYPGPFALEVIGESSKNIGNKDALTFLRRAYESARKYI